MLKSYPNFTLDYVLHDLSYQNLILLSSIIPGYDSGSRKKSRTPGSSAANAGGLKGLFTTLKNN